MAYGVAHRFEVYAYHTGHYWRVDLAQDGYVGSINESADLAASAPLTITQQGRGGEKFFTASGNVAKGTSAQLRIFIENASQEANFKEFGTVEEREWKMLIYKGTAAGNETLYHELFVQPDVYRFPYSPYPYFIDVLATDEIGRLNAIKFQPTDITRYADREPIMFFVYEILNKLGVQREIVEVCNLYCDSMSIALSNSPLTQATIDPTKYLINKGRENEDVMDCHTVLNDLLKIMGCILFLGSDNRWHLKRVNELAAASIVQRIFNSATNVVSSGTITTHKKATNSNTDNSIMTFINAPEVVMDWRWKRASIKFIVGDNGNFVFDGELAPSAWINNNTLSSWVKVVSPPANDYSWNYERSAPFTSVNYPEGTQYPFSVGASEIAGNYITIGSGGHEELDDGDQVLLIGSDVPAVLNANRPYYVVNKGVNGETTLQLAQTQGGTPQNINNSGTAPYFIAKLGTESIEYAVRLNSHIDTEWSGTGYIQNNNGIRSKAIDVLSQSGNTFSIDFYWKITASPAQESYSTNGIGYYAITVTTDANVVYYFNKLANSWSTVIYYNTLEDPDQRYPWIKEEVSGEFPVDGKFELTLFQASATSLDVQYIEFAAINGELLIGGVANTEFVEKIAEVGKEYAYDADTIELLTGDAPAVIFQGHIGIQGSGALAKNWYRRGVSEDKELLDILLQCYMNNYGRTTLKVDGQLMGNLAPEQVLEDANLAYAREGEQVTPTLMLTGGTLDCKESIWDAEFTEINE